MQASADTNEAVWYHSNTLYSLYALTDNSESVVERYRYDAYGAATVLDADGSDDADGLSDAENPYLFTARRLDLESDLMYYRNRQYSVTLGPFISRDPQGYADWFNLYCYVMAQATRRVDPMGLGPPDWQKKLQTCFSYYLTGFCIGIFKCMDDVGRSAKGECIRNALLTAQMIGLVGLDILIVFAGAYAGTCIGGPVGAFIGGTLGALVAFALTYEAVMHVIGPCLCIHKMFSDMGATMERECWARWGPRGRRKRR